MRQKPQQPSQNRPGIFHPDFPVPVPIKRAVEAEVEFVPVHVDEAFVGCVLLVCPFSS